MSYESDPEYHGKQIRESTKRTCLMTHKNKTDEELMEIVNHNSVAIYSQDDLETYKTVGETEACVELLKQRREQREYKNAEEESLWGSLQHWEEANDARRKKAITRLPHATSYHGQLVAAVLEEEEGLTAEEIRKWSDELTTMNDKEYHRLLEGLCREDIVYYDEDDKYYILSLCTPDLFPSNPSLWLEYHHCYGYGKFLQHMVATRKPLTERDWIEISGSYFNKRDLEENPKKAYQNVKKNYLDSYVKDGALSVTPIPDSDLNYYYFTMLGEWEGE